MLQRIGTTTTTTTMSSPEQRRSNRSSVNGTPRRSSQAPASSPSLPNDQNENAAADQQLRSEASDANMQDVTPRGATRSSQNISQSQAPPTSSPLFFRSSPNGSQSQSQSAQQSAGAAAPSSPLKRQVDAPSSDGGRTPRASGMGMGGGRLFYIKRFHALMLMRCRLFTDPLCFQF